MWLNQPQDTLHFLPEKKYKITVLMKCLCQKQTTTPKFVKNKPEKSVDLKGEVIK